MRRKRIHVIKYVCKYAVDTDKLLRYNDIKRKKMEDGNEQAREEACCAVQ